MNRRMRLHLLRAQFRTLWHHWKDMRSGDRWWYPMTGEQEGDLANHFFDGWGLEEALHAVRLHDGGFCDGFHYEGCPLMDEAGAA